jgi:ribonucleotide reductase beta subunit family protein with ferritin-like domain
MVGGKVEHSIQENKIMNKIEEAFDTLANIAGGIIQNNKFQKLSSAKVSKTKLKHNLEKFYCLSVPETAFVIKANDKISITGNCHSDAGAWLFRTLKDEAVADGQLTSDELIKLNIEIEDTAKVILEHESIIIDKIFEKGTIKGITPNQLQHFVESRLDLCLENLSFNAVFKPSYNPIANWFYKDIESSTLHDFFSSTGNDYNRAWSEGKFLWQLNQ